MTHKHLSFFLKRT